MMTMMKSIVSYFPYMVISCNSKAWKVGMMMEILIYKVLIFINVHTISQTGGICKFDGIFQGKFYRVFINKAYVMKDSVNVSHNV